MHFRIAGLRIIPLLLQLIIRRSTKTRCGILILRIKQGGASPSLLLISRHDKKASDVAPF